MRLKNREVFEVFLKRFQQHTQMRQSMLYHEMLSIVAVPLLQRPVLDVSVGPSFLITGCPGRD